ncbi:MAG: DUF2513 domain-containing protein [Gammaproteobacteria bacterium]|jgi:hypothetical protein
MRRDFDLIRQILFVAEGAKPEQRISLKDFEERHADSLEEVSEHVQLLDRAGYLNATVSKELSPNGPRQFFINRLEWAGHDYLDAVRDSGIWARTKERLGVVGGSASLEIVKAVAVKVVSEALGL